MIQPGFLLHRLRLSPGRLLAAMLAALLTLGGCSSLPRPVQSPQVTQALPLSPQTPLGRLALSSMHLLTSAEAVLTAPGAAPPMPDGSTQDLSGFRLLPLGTHLLNARLQLIQRSQVSLDLHYYHFADDSTGRAVCACGC